MNLSILCSTSFFSIEKYPFPIYPNINIDQDKNILINKFFTEQYASLIGTIEVDHLKNNPFIYGFKNDLKYLDNTIFNTYMENLSRQFQRFMFFLWFVKDNSANIGKFYIYDLDSKGMRNMVSTVNYSNNEGHYVDSLFTIDDIQKSIDITLKYDSIQTIKMPTKNDYKLTHGAIQESEYNYHDYKSNNRIDLAIQFLQMARSSSFLPFKISMYMPVYEALFSDSNHEAISHKIGERVAYYLGGTKLEKEKIYSILKKGYSFRSSYIHGSLPKVNLREAQTELSVDLDNLTRIVLNKIIEFDAELFLTAEKDFKIWLDNLIFQDCP